MSRIKATIKCVLAIFMISVGIMHFVNPSLFRPLLLSSASNAVMYAIGVLQILIGIGLVRSVYVVIKGHRRFAGSTWLEIHHQVLEENIHTNSADANKQVLLTESEAKRFIRTRDYKSLLSYTAIDEPAAEVLSGFDGSLALWIRSIPDYAAHAMSKHIGMLVLNFLSELSDVAAESLSKHQGDLFLKGLHSLSDAAESLSQHQHRLSLTGLEFLSDKAARSLLKHPDLEIDLSRLSESAAMILRERHGCDD
jgi:hypothetical protein